MIDWVVATKVAGTVGRVSAQRGVRAAVALLLPRRVASAAYKRARASGLRFTKGELRTALKRGRILEALLIDGDALHARAESELRRVVYTDEAASVLLLIVARCYIELASDRDALQVVTDVQTKVLEERIAAEGEATRALLAVKNDFEANLESLHPLRAAEARALASRWPGVRECVALLVADARKKELLESWKDSEPAWLAEAPAEALTWLGEAAIDHGASAAADAFLRRALDRGVNHRSYWLCRIAIANPRTESEVLELLQPVSADPFPAALLADMRGDQLESLEHLEAWRPATPGQEATKGAVVARLLLVTDDLAGAIDAGEVAFREYTATGAALTAAEAHLLRGARSTSPSRVLDLQEALALAIECRNLQRRWGVDSTRAVLQGAQAARVIGNSGLAWRLVRTDPGEATAEEAGAADIVNFAALMAAENDIQPDLQQLRRDVQAPAIKTVMDGFAEDRRGDSAAAAELWTRAIGETDNVPLKVEITQFLAQIGVRSPYLDELRVLNADLATRIELTARVLSGDETALAQARANAQADRTDAMVVVLALERSERFDQAARAAQLAAERWGDPDLWIKAAINFRRVGSFEESRTCAREALRSAPAMWGGKARAYRLLFDLAWQLHEWEAAVESAVAIVQEEPDDPAGVWALITAQALAEAWEDARTSFVQLGKRPAARNEDDAVLIANLFRRFGTDAVPFDLLQHLAQEWSTSEHVRGALVGALLMNKQRDDVDVDAARRMIEQFLTDFPGTSLLMQVSVDPEDPLAAINEIFQDVPDLTALETQAATGQLPLGFIAELRPRGYGEAIVTRATGLRFCGTSSTDEIQDLVSAARGGCVVDLTAVATCALLSGLVQLRAFFEDLILPREQQRDAVQGVEALERMTTLSLIPRSGGRGVAVHEISEAQLAQFRREAAGLRDESGSIRAITTTALPRAFDDDRLGVRTPWLAAVDLAKARDVPLWCDDRALRLLASTVGVRSFSTFDLLSVMQMTGAEQPGVAQTASATLIANGYVGLPFDAAILRAAARIGGTNGAEIAQALRFGGPSDDPAQKVAFAINQLELVRESPSDLQGWSFNTTRWLTEVAGSPVAAEGNVTLFLKNVLAQRWLTADNLGFVLRGVRDAGAVGDEIDRPIAAAFRARFTQLAPRIGYPLASEYLRGLVERASDRDRTAVITAIFTKN